MNPFICLFFGNPRRLAGTLAGVAMLVAIFAPGAFHWFTERAADELNWTLGTLVTKLWPWIQIGAFVAIAAGVILSILRPKKGGS